MRTAIVTDTNSSISPAQAQEEGIFLLPMPVIINEKTYLEGIDIEATHLYEAMEQECNISTSQPSPDSIMKLWDSILADGYDEIVHIPMTSGLSGSCHTAMMLADDYNGKVCVVDNHRISVTQRASVFDAVHMAKEGKSAKEIKERLEANALQASIYLTVESLKYLQKGGRLSPSAAMLGAVLNIKPVLSIQGEKIDAVAKVRGMKNCEKKIIESMQQDMATRFADVPVERIRLYVAGTLQSEDAIIRWKTTIQELFPEYQIEYYPLPCSIATHLGPGSLALALAITED